MTQLRPRLPKQEPLPCRGPGLAGASRLPDLPPHEQLRVLSNAPRFHLFCTQAIVLCCQPDASRTIMLRVLLSVAATAAAVVAAPARPNIVLVYLDDVGYGDLSVNGAPTIQTPHLDRLAAEGVKLTQYYTAAPICTPSRGALLTGRLPVRTGLYFNGTFPLSQVFRVFQPASTGCLGAQEVTIPKALKPLGYFNAMFGKWHLGWRNGTCTPRTSGGFDYYYGLPYSQYVPACMPRRCSPYTAPHKQR